MNTSYNPDLKADLSVDEEGKVRYIDHSQEYWLSDYNSPLSAAIDYLENIHNVFQIPAEQLNHLQQQVSFLDPREQGLDYQLSEEKQLFDSTTYGFYQTYMNVPVWRAGLSVTVEQNPSRVVHSANNSQEGVDARLPAAEAIERHKRLCRQAEVSRLTADTGEEGEEEHETASFIRDILGISRRGEAAVPDDRARLTRGRFFMYRYDEKNRQATHPADDPDDIERGTAGDIEKDDVQPTLSLPPVPDEIKDGQYYLVTEIVFSLTTPQWGRLNWRALVEVETNAVLYLRALVAGVNGLVFTYDPITSTGVLTNTADNGNGVLDALRDDESLPNLDAPVAGTQPLTGRYVQVVDDDAPAIVPPTVATGNDFDYQVRTDNFSAVNAYYHPDRVFALIEDLGFPISTYFDGTNFPVHVDHRASTSGTSGIEINAFCQGDIEGDGIGLVGYCLGDLSDTTNPIGRAVDKWVHWHEIGGHGILWDHVDSPNFGFAHSAGDGLAALQNDPESQLRALPERFRYAPFRAGLDRWFNRDVASGWAWGGSQDIGGYESEQILATTHFRIYRSIGGDADDVARRWFASRVVTYLILRAVGTLMPGTNPSDALGFCNTLMAVDRLNWTSEGLDGGAYNKVIRWAFEKQGLFQPSGAPTPVTTAGAPPAVDVYINDGRNGEYQFQAAHWQNMSMWNRNSPDGLPGHQNAVEGATNFMYGKVKNRGTSAATNVTVRSYHSLPGAGLTWPNDFTEMSPAGGHSIAAIGANNSEEVTVGPFEWVPNVNVYGHDCVLMIASVDGDPSNIDNFTGTETIAEWRLVPNDNNIGQRNVSIVPGGGGPEALMAALNGAPFFAGNSFNRPATMELRVDMPSVLASKGWRLRFADLDDDDDNNNDDNNNDDNNNDDNNNDDNNNEFRLKAGKKRRIRLKLSRGDRFTADEIRNAADRNISVYLYGNGILLGAMTYQLDPDLTEPSGGKRRPRVE